MLLESQIQNAFLARNPAGAVNLATFALAVSSFQLLNAFLVFVPQTVTLLARCPRSRKMCFRFVVAAGAVLSLPLLIIGFLPPGTRLFAYMMRIPPELLPNVLWYLQLMTPLMIVNAVRHYFTGILIRLGRTRILTLLNLCHLLTLVAVLAVGRLLGWPAILTVAIGAIGANLVHLGLISTIAAEKKIPANETPWQRLRYREILSFFWPVAITSGMFALSRPVMYSYINRTAMAVTTVAALRLAFDATMFFQNPVNQFRHMFTTFGEEDFQGVKRFMFRNTGWFTVVMLLLAFSPLGRLLFERVIGAEGEVLEQAIQALRILCLGPLTIALRNLYHGRMMIRRRTRGMAVAGIFRVIAIAFLAWSFYHLGWLNHQTSALMLISGFAAETFMSRHAVSRFRRRKTET